MHRACSPLTILALLLLGASARAEEGDPAAAQMLFDDAKRLLAKGSVAEACPKFLASFKLDPKPGALLNLADCYEKNGQTASAWARYLETAALAHRAGQAERERYARAHATALEPKLSRLTVMAPGAASGQSVTRDGVALDAATWGTAVPVDPGEHVVEAQAPGKRAWSMTVTVGAGDAGARVEVPALADAPGSPPRGGEDAASPGSGRRIAGIVLMGAGAAGLVVGSVFAAKAHSDYGDLSAACPVPTHCAPALAPDIAAYHVASSTFVTSFVGAGILLGTGLGVFFTAPQVRSRAGAFVAPRVGAGYVGVEGGF